MLHSLEGYSEIVCLRPHLRFKKGDICTIVSRTVNGDVIAVREGSSTIIPIDRRFLVYWVERIKVEVDELQSLKDKRVALKEDIDSLERDFQYSLKTLHLLIDNNVNNTDPHLYRYHQKIQQKILESLGKNMKECTQIKEKIYMVAYGGNSEEIRTN